MLEKETTLIKSTETDLKTYKVVLNFKGKGIGVNDKYTINKRTRRIILTDQYRQFEELLFYAVRPEFRNLMLKPPYDVKIEFITYKDIDAMVKPCLDTLTRAGVIEDDREVLDNHNKKIKAKRGSEDLIIVSILC